VNGRELFVTTRKPSARKPRKKREPIGNNNETPKRGRPRKRQDATTPDGKPVSRTPQTADRIPDNQVPETETEEPFVLDVEDATETSQAETELEPDEERSTWDASELEDSGFEVREYEFETPTRNNRDNSPLPVEPYVSLHSSRHESPVYEEYQVPIPTSSSPPRPSESGSTPYARRASHRFTSPVSTPTSMEQIRRQRARSRSASRERRMSFAPLAPGQGLPPTPRRQSVSPIHATSNVDEEMESIRSPSTQYEDEDGLTDHLSAPLEEIHPVHIEGMTPVRNWAAELAEGAFKFGASPSKFTQLPIANNFAIPPPSPTMEEVSDEDEPESQHSIRESSRLSIDTPLTPKLHPQIGRLKESPIVITSSPPDIPSQPRYQWKSVPIPTPEDQSPAAEEQTFAFPEESQLPLQDEEWEEQPPEDDESEPAISVCQSQVSSRQSSPARSILEDFGDDVIDISSMSPLAAKRAANILLRSQYYSKISFDDETGQRIWDDAQSQAGDYELSQIEISDEVLPEEEVDEEDDEVDEDDADDEQGDQQEGEEAKAEEPIPLPRVSEGEWGKLDWKRLEKCLDYTDGEMNEAIDLFQQRYIGRQREELEMRSKALLLTRRRRVLEGVKVEFILSTDQ